MARVILLALSVVHVSAQTNLTVGYSQADCCKCLTFATKKGSSSTPCTDRCSTSGSDCKSCVHYAGGSGCIFQNRCTCGANPWSWKAAGQVGAGLVMGVVGAQDIQSCITNTLKDIETLEAAIVYLRKKTAQDVQNGLKKLADAFVQLPDVMSSCKAVYSDIQTVVKAFKTLSNPGSFAFTAGKNLIFNGKDIYKEVMTACDDYDSQKWNDLGVQVGTALHKLLIGMQTLELQQANSTNSTGAVHSSIVV